MDRESTPAPALQDLPEQRAHILPEVARGYRRETLCGNLQLPTSLRHAIDKNLRVSRRMGNPPSLRPGKDRFRHELQRFAARALKLPGLLPPTLLYPVHG